MGLQRKIPQLLSILIMSIWLIVGLTQYIRKMDQLSLFIFLKSSPSMNEMEAGDEFMHILTRMSRTTSPDRIAITRNEGETDAEFSYHYFWTTFVFPRTTVIPYASADEAFSKREPFIYTGANQVPKGYVVTNFGNYRVLQRVE